MKTLSRFVIKFTSLIVACAFLCRSRYLHGLPAHHERVRPRRLRRLRPKDLTV